MKRIQNTDSINAVKLALDCIRQAYEKFSSELVFVQCTVSPISAGPGYSEWLNEDKSQCGKGKNKNQFDSSPKCIKKLLPADPTPRQISELILSLEVDHPEEARQLSLAVLQAPSYKHLNQNDRECPLTLFINSQLGEHPEFFKNWKNKLSEHGDFIVKT